jgi:hypothetical protein
MIDDIFKNIVLEVAFYFILNKKLYSSNNVEKPFGAYQQSKD